MPTIEVPALTKIDIDRVFQPFPDSKTWKDGAKRGAIKAKNGIKYQVKETLLKQFQDGEFGVEVEVKKFGDKDNPGHEIVKRVGWNGQAGIPKQNYKQRMDPADARGAFISLMCEAWATAGMIAVDDGAVARARLAAARGYDKSHSPQHRDDMNDEVPEDGWQTPSENPAD